MNDEIKEMIEQMQSIAITGKSKNGIKVDGYGLQQNELKMFLDYITNLQQENERLKQNINKVLNDINRYLEGRKIINDNTKYYYTNEFYKRPIKSNIAYLFNDYLHYLIYLLGDDDNGNN